MTICDSESKWKKDTYSTMIYVATSTAQQRKPNNKIMNKSFVESSMCMIYKTKKMKMGKIECKKYAIEDERERKMVNLVLLRFSDFVMNNDKKDEKLLHYFVILITVVAVIIVVVSQLTFLTPHLISLYNDDPARPNRIYNLLLLEYTRIPEVILYAPT